LKYKAAVFFMLFGVALGQQVPGWEMAVPLAGTVREYSAAEDPYRNYRHSIVTAGPGESDAKTDRRILRFSFGEDFSEIATIEIPKKGDAGFPVYPGVASSAGNHLIVYQLPGQKFNQLKFIYIPEKGNKTDGEIPTEQGKNAILPSVYASEPGSFLVFYHQSMGDNRYALTVRSFEGGKFTGRPVLVQKESSIERGVFFPDVSVSGKKVTVVYQGRMEKNLRDEIFLSISDNGGASFQNPVQLTQNAWNDIAPSLSAGTGEKWIAYQSNEGKIWGIEIFDTATRKRERISETQTNSYNPVMAVAANTGRIVVWQDYAKGVSKIVARFLDKKATKKVFNTFAVSREGGLKPRLLGTGKNIYLYYIQAGTLYRRKLDNTTEPLLIASKTHPEGKVSRLNSAVFEWNLPKDLSGIDGFAYLIDERRDTVPPMFNLPADKTSIQIGNISGGRYYFHLLYRDSAGNESPVSHYSFIVDNAAPTPPSIASQTHQENIPGTGDLVSFRLDSTDDSGVSSYLYSLSQNPDVKATEEISENVIQLRDIAPGRYFFKAQAKDTAGNLSEPSVFELLIGGVRNEEISLHSSLRNEMLPGEDIRFQAWPKTRTPKHARITLASEPLKNLDKADVVPFVKEKELYAFVFKAPEQEGMWVASVEVETTDGYKLPVRHYYFRVRSKKQETEIARRPAVSGKRERPVYQLVTDNTIIEISEDGGIYSLSFQQSGTERATGYAWSLTEVPEDPGREMNSLGGPEYLYLLPEGEYFINVRPIFRNRIGNVVREKLNSIYDRQGHIVVLEKYFWGSGYKNAGMAAMFAGGLILLGISLVRNRKRVLFYLSRFRRVS